ncbi:glycosyltransferase family 2 protein [Pedobacter sp. SL55]|uniref:glycosyltransferase family 2 protein n=1 Tax=Pedobacter sp. SL55 TaxID=2995161 RepID=UPI002271426B|nr:glycosyltransferase [Pedobacter sp. SL55]WAC41237.1 glycosyltransferase [Pedobacter sp. SL55]
MKEDALVSVIIPVYNGGQYVKACINMMLNQSYKNLEIIVVDDGSVDNSAAIAQEFPVKLIRHDQNRGLSAARNTGIDAAQGKYIHFMDVDDEINLDYYKALVEAITEMRADIACGGMINETKNYKTWLFKKREVFTDTNDKLKATFVGKWGYVWRYLFSLDFLKQHKLRFEEGRFIEDLMFSLPAVFYAERVVVVPGAEYLYYQRENSIMTRKDEAHRKKRREDHNHTKAYRAAFCKEHNIKIPGLDTGRTAYVLRKVVKWIWK